MNCPKCHHRQQGEGAECEKCGIIFAKYYSSLNAQGEVEGYGEDDSSFSGEDLFFYTKAENNIFAVIGRCAVFILTVYWGARFIISPLESNYAAESFMHLVNLPFHEAGHMVFRVFGPYMASLGGTIGQLLMPLICFSVLLMKTRDTFGASVALWWFGQNFFDIAPYVNDARSLSLPLVGGNFGHSSPYGFHDWEYLLTESGLLHYDHVIAKSCLTVGAIIFLVSFAWGGILLCKQYKSRV